jgi:succinate dehydrogenase flavin-adding protein (antitoxin of CptAB toxin-antitoxin module)
MTLTFADHIRPLLANPDAARRWSAILDCSLPALRRWASGVFEPQPAIQRAVLTRIEQERAQERTRKSG